MNSKLKQCFISVCAVLSVAKARQGQIKFTAELFRQVLVFSLGRSDVNLPEITAWLR